MKAVWSKRSQYLFMIAIALPLAVLIAWKHGLFEGVPPPETPVGQVRSFDELLRSADAAWDFLFVEGQAVDSVVIQGQNLTRATLTRDDGVVLLDIRKVSADPDAHIFGRCRLSPDRTHLAVCYGGCQRKQAVNCGLGVYDLLSMRWIPLNLDVPGAETESAERYVHWLSTRVFIVGIYGPADVEKRRWLRYSLDAPPNGTEVSIPVEPELFFRKRGCPDLYITSARYLIGDPAIQSKVDDRVVVLSTDGLREGTADERRQLRQADTSIHIIGHDFSDDDEELIPKAVPPLQVAVKEILSRSFVKLEYWDQPYSLHTWAKFDIFLGGRRVRRSPYEVQGPQWDPELRLYIWSESDWREANPECFVMDSEGHYRRWRTGRYVGKLPKGLIGRSLVAFHGK